jgi:hypothetical protein
MKHIHSSRWFWTLLFLLVAFGVLAQSSPQNEAGRRVFVVRQLNALGIVGYEYSARGPEDELVSEIETEIGPGFYGASLQLGIGTIVLDQLLLAFAPAVWYWPSFQAFAYTPGAVLAKYAFGEGPVAPVITAHGGIYIELPQNYFGFFGEIGFGIELRRPNSSPLQLTLGYLYNGYEHDGEAPVDEETELQPDHVPYLNIDEVRRHSVSIGVSMSYGSGN